MGKWMALLTGALLLSACGGRDATVTTTRSDSAGVVIVMNVGPDEPAASSPRSLDYRLGGEPSGPESFYQLYPWQVRSLQPA